jgi:hypothetical protein
MTAFIELQQGEIALAADAASDVLLKRARRR